MRSHPAVRILAVLAAAVLVGGCLEEDPLSPRARPPAAPAHDASILDAPGEIVAFATNVEEGEVYVIRDRDHALLRTLPVSTQPQHVTFSPDGRRVYVTHHAFVQESDGTASVTVLRAADASIAATLPAVPGRALNTATVVPDGGHVYFTNSRYRADDPDSYVQVMRTRDLQIVDRVDAGPHLMGVAAPDGSRVYMTGCLPCSSTDGGFVTVVRTSDNAIVATIPVEPEPNRIAITPDGSRVYVSHPRRGEVTVIRTSDDTVVDVLDVPFALPLAVNPDGSRLYTANRPFGETGSVTVFRIEDHSVETVFDVGVNPQALAFTPDGDRLYVTNAGSGTVSVYRTSDHALVAEVVVGEGVTFIDLAELPSAGEQIADLLDAVDGLESGGALNRGQARALRNHLANAARSLEDGHLRPAAAQLGAFLSQVEDLVADGGLSDEEGEVLLSLAAALLAHIEGGSDGAGGPGDG